MSIQWFVTWLLKLSVIATVRIPPIPTIPLIWLSRCDTQECVRTRRLQRQLRSRQPAPPQLPRSRRLPPGQRWQRRRGRIPRRRRRQRGCAGPRAPLGCKRGACRGYVCQREVNLGCRAEMQGGSPSSGQPDVVSSLPGNLACQWRGKDTVPCRHRRRRGRRRGRGRRWGGCRDWGSLHGGNRRRFVRRFVRRCDKLVE